MGFYGFIYVACGFIGIFTFGVKSCKFNKWFKEEFSGSSEMQNAIKSDINQTINTIKSVIND